jgi:drug/metabolite transporter (DMT)-like permease
VLLLGWIVLIATVLAYATGVLAVRRLSPQVAGVVACLEAVIATVLAWVLLGEHLSAPQVVGGAVVLAGAYVAQRAVPAHSSPAAEGAVASGAGRDTASPAPRDPADARPGGPPRG